MTIQDGLAIQTFINPEQKANSYKSSGNNYLSLRNNTRFFRETSFELIEPQEAVSKVDNFLEELNKLNESSSAIPRRAWKLAKKDIEAGYHEYRVDKEKNN